MEYIEVLWIGIVRLSEEEVVMREDEDYRGFFDSAS